MSKRFTDTKKWRNYWFRSLPVTAKLTWIYLCDECESHGVLKIDYDLASFQLGFECTPTLVSQWFGDKVVFLKGAEEILIVQFFEFQYGESKDSWTAKVRAKEKLEKLGFNIENNKLLISLEHSTPTVPPQDMSCGTTRLIRVRGRVRGRVNKEEEEVNDFFRILNSSEFQNVWLTKASDIESIETFLQSQNAFGEIKSPLFKKTKNKFLATLAHVYGNPEDLKLDLTSIINEKTTDEKTGISKSDYITTRLKNKALELYNATR